MTKSPWIAGLLDALRTVEDDEELCSKAMLDVIMADKILGRIAPLAEAEAFVAELLSPEGRARPVDDLLRGFLLQVSARTQASRLRRVLADVSAVLEDSGASPVIGPEIQRQVDRVAVVADDGVFLVVRVRELARGGGDDVLRAFQTLLDVLGYGDVGVRLEAARRAAGLGELGASHERA